MNTLVATELTRRLRPDAGFRAAPPAGAPRPTGFPLLLCGLVMALALLSFFVQVLNEHVQRAQQLHSAPHRSAAASIVPAGSSQPADAPRQGLVQTAAR